VTEVLAVVNLVFGLVAIAGWWRASLERRRSKDRRILSAGVALARAITSLDDPDGIRTHVIATLRKLEPTANWRGYTAEEIERGNVPDDVPLQVLREALDEGARVDTTTTVVAAHVDARLPFTIVGLGDHEAVYIVLLGDRRVVTADTLSRVELILRVASSALRAAAQREILVANARLAAIGRLAAGIAHEINNPLAYVTLNLQNLEEVLEGPPLEWCRDAIQGSKRIGRILTGLRSAGRSDDLETQQVDLRALAEDTASVARARDMHTPIEVEGPPVRVIGDEVKLSQIFLNLITNALDAVAGVPRPRVKVRVGVDGDMAIVDVVDNGRGVPPELRKKIFAEGVSTKGRNGQGLGLYLARSLALAHGGMVELIGSGPDGSTFRFSMPSAQAGSSIPAPPLQTAEAPRIGRPRILLIDDEPAILRALKRQLRRRAQVVTYDDPRAGLRAAISEPFDLILCDLNMPGLGGTEIADELARHNPSARERLVIMTGSLEIDLDVPTLRKPIERAVLAKLVDEWDPAARRRRHSA